MQTPSRTLPTPGALLRKSLIFVHRWLGLAFCLLFTMWFLSGIVMMYSDYPSVVPGERLAKAPALNAADIKIEPKAALSALGWDEAPDEVRLSIVDGRPVYRFRSGRELGFVFADSGNVVEPLDDSTLQRIAADWVGLPRESAKFQGRLAQADQWTLSGELAPLRPLLKYAWPDGQEVYVSAVTGEVAQHTTRGVRTLAYFGAIPHWLYFTPLRRNGRLWNKVVVWSSGIGTFASLLGLAVGVWMYSPSKRYRYNGAPSSIPYRGQKRLHLILGLLFGFVTCTWVFSGLLSMEPFDWLSDDTDTPGLAARALREGPMRLTDFAGKSPSEALRELGPGTKVKELSLGVFGGEPYYIAHQAPNVSKIVPVNGAAFEQFDQARILQLISKSLAPAAIAESRVLTEYDAYYLDRHRQHPLPALLVRVNDSADSALYIDLKTAQLVEAYGRRSRINRWIYHGLHSWNLPWLYRYRPAWDIFVLLLLAGGTCLCITSVILGFELLRRKIYFKKEQFS